jgi:serine/threonine kinase PknH
MSDTGPAIGTQFGPYLLKRLLGSGGMGTVYEAQDTVMDRVVALKLISGVYAQDSDYRQRLQREARIAGRLHEPHVVPIHSTGEIDGQLYVDMRLIHGTDLDTMIKQSGPLSPAKAVSMVRQVASALDAAHAAGVLHRDVKPGNILIAADDFAYLVDFGIANAATEAKLTQVGDTLGTWTYMAPERFTGDETKVTPSADTYALACVLFEALTGTPPFTGDRATLVASHLTQPPPRASARVGLPPALDDVIARGMAKRPEERYASSGDFARAAEEAIASLGSVTAAMPLPTMAAFMPQPGPSTPPPGPRTPPPGPRTPPPGPRTPPPGPHTHWTQPPASPPQYGQPPVTPWPEPSPKGGNRGKWIAIAAAIGLVVALAAGVGIWKLTGNKSSSEAQRPDVSKLDVGRYETKPRPLTGPATKQEGVFLESFRLAEGIANPYDVDPVLDHLYGTAIGDSKTAATAIAGTGTPLTQPVLDKYGMISAYLVHGMSRRFQDFAREKNGDTLMIMLTSFPNEDAAARAAAEMEATDFAVNPENKSVKVPGYPQAKAHYRDFSPSVAATVASGRLVASIGVRSDAHPDLSYLLQRIQRVLDLQMPLMARLLPTVEVSLTSMPRDDDGMLSRAFIVGDQPKISDTFGSVGPLATAFCADSQPLKDGLYVKAGIDRCAITHDAVLLRARDEKAAQALVPKLVEANRQEYADHDVAAPAGVVSARCYETKRNVWADNANSRFGCWVTYGRYVALVWSNEEKDLNQRAAAQYAILVNSA